MATDVQIPHPAARATGGAAGALALAGLMAVAGVIHLVATVEHIGEDAALAVFFVLVGAGQLFAGWSIHRNAADARLLRVVAVASVVVALLWISSRTTGLPVGPEAGRRPVGVGDTTATLLELSFAAIVALLTTGRERRVAWLDGEIGTRLTFAVLSLALLLSALGGHEH